MFCLKWCRDLERTKFLLLFLYLSVLGSVSFASVLQLRILTTIFKIFQIQKYEKDIVLNIVTTLQKAFSV